MTGKVPIQRIYDDLDWVSNRISEQVRRIALGVLAMAWLFLAGGSNAPNIHMPGPARALLAIAGLAVAALLCDYIQYLAGYVAASKVRRVAEGGGGEKASYSTHGGWYRLRSVLFWVNQVLAGGATIWLLVLVVMAVT